MIQLNDISFWYQRNKMVLSKMTMQLEAGKIYGLLGENGVGKTTFLRIVAGLLFPKSGDIDVMGFKPEKRTPSFLSDIFYLPEEFDSPHEKVNEYAKLNGGFYPAFNAAQFQSNLELFGISGNQRFTEMSYGQKKKALISYALATNTSLLLLDEPTNGLDIPSKGIFRRLVSQAADESKCIIISTHQVRDLELIIDPIVILEPNQVLLNDSVEAITRKLKFSIEPTVPEGALYYEPTMGGYNVVSINTEGVESKLNIELLFNAVISNRAHFRTLYTQAK
ncbi:ATP-binding cassette domain-containing protein [Microbacter margulisiae]|uniref:ABC-2 type transport system ATP-binding protein n=1 Tax=Microbacter margulisiae TaxID=1350067 RepID=A0A7W5H0Y8_9PORP|nr:ABC transporter ATP-binding protein [Microbacter margulisiae]MBB3186170.1 ABC-2 type transport system ATP-binding protein [Microbacter margulisiae]